MTIFVKLTRVKIEFEVKITSALTTYLFMPDESPELAGDFGMALWVNWSNSVCSVLFSILFNTVWKGFNVQKITFPNWPSPSVIQAVPIYFKECLFSANQWKVGLNFKDCNFLFRFFKSLSQSELFELGSFDEVWWVAGILMRPWNIPFC